MDLGHLLVAEVLDALQREVVTLSPDGTNVVTGIGRGLDRLRRPRIVREDHRRRPLRQQRIEKPHLGGHIGLDRGMIIHVVPAEIGEGGCRKLDAVEPALVEAVAGGLHRGMRHAFSGKFRQQLMQRHRIGRRQRAIFVARRRDDARRADHRGRVACMRPDLPGERSDGGFARGAGDGDHSIGLPAVETRGGDGKETARLLDRKHRDRSSDGLGGDRDGSAAAGSIRDEARTVRLGAGDRDESIARRHLAAVRRQA